jgi:hypothetical protein
LHDCMLNKGFAKETIFVLDPKKMF